MLRIVSLAIFAGLVAYLFLGPEARPEQLAAFQAGSLLEEPELRDARRPWFQQAQVGDRVWWSESADGAPTAHTIAALAGGEATLVPEGEDEAPGVPVRLESLPALPADRAGLEVGDRVHATPADGRGLRHLVVAAVEGDRYELVEPLVEDPVPLELPLADLPVSQGGRAPIEPRPLWRAIQVEGLRDEDGTPVLVLGGARFQSLAANGTDFEPGEFDLIWHGESRNSVLRALRTAGQEHGFRFEERGRKRIDRDEVEGGVHFDTTLLRDADGETTLRLDFWVGEATAETARFGAAKRWHAPNQRSLLPPLVAIFLAILLRRPIVSLFAGVLVGATLLRLAAGEGFAVALGDGVSDVVRVYLVDELRNRGRTEIILFVVFMLAMVGIITRAGGIRGLMQAIARMASDARRTQIAAWLMGLAVFFDDYANTILVGSTMRPLTDRFKVAREKLAWIVDSTAAPVAGVSIFSTWIAFEVSTFSAQLPDAEMTSGMGYAVFLQTLPFRFYCWLMLFFVGLMVFSGRDFGPMLKAERRARAGRVLREGAQPMVSRHATDLEASERVTPRAVVALVPLLSFILGTIGLILHAGGAFEMGSAFFTIEGVTQVLYSGSGEEPLMQGAAIGLVLAVVLALFQGLRLEILTSALKSLLAMGVALVILYLAWMVGAVCSDLGTADYLSVSLGSSLPFLVLPIVLFLLAALVAFSTGSSWSTMTILLPLVVGLAYSLGAGAAGIDQDPVALGQGLVVISIGAVLEGAIFGDHCSPISDTTVMSSIATASDHIDHVRTQMPYAIVVMLVALLCGYLPCAFFLDEGWTWLPYVCLAVSMAILFGISRMYGRRASDEPLEESLDGPTGTPPAPEASA